MIIYENIRLALFSLKANKMRALLTMLGIIIGIASVIAIMTLGDSVTQTVTDNMSSIGANNVTVSIQQRSSEDEEDVTAAITGISFGEDDSAKEPEESDYITREMLQQFCESYENSIRTISISEKVGTGEVQQGARTSGISVLGTSAGYFMANDIDVLAGHYFTQREFDNGERVAMIAQDVVDDIFDGDAEAAIGSKIQIMVNDKYYDFIVSGVYAEADNSTMPLAMMFAGQTSDFYIPLRTAQAIDHSSGFSAFTVMTKDGVNADDFAADTEAFFANLYRNNRDFEVTATSLSSIVSMMESMMDTITTAIAFIAAIALVVGGIGVMNIMLVSITERTREIGTRKALGAPNSSIRLQFIIESIVICIIGGIIGIILGCIVGMAAAAYVRVSTVPSLRSICISLGFSMAISIFFGYYPANKAAKLNPIDALRYE